MTETLPAGCCRWSAFGTGGLGGRAAADLVHEQHRPFTSGTITVNGVVNSGSVTPALIPSSTTAVDVLRRRQPGDILERPARHGPGHAQWSPRSPRPTARRAAATMSRSPVPISAGRRRLKSAPPPSSARGHRPPWCRARRAQRPGCFTITSGTTLDIRSMPAHAAGSGHGQGRSASASQGSGGYTYNPGPALLFPAAPGGEAERGLQRPADRDRRDQPVHLVGERRDAAPRGDPGGLDRAAVRYPDGRGHLFVHVMVTDHLRPDRDRAGDRDRHRRSVAEFPGPAVGLDPHGLLRHPDRVRRHQPVRVVGEQPGACPRASASAATGT